METKKCGDCFHADVCEEADTLVGFSRENLAYCGMFLDNADVVEAVRCRDCRHFTEGMAIGMCKRIPERPIIPMPYNNYCGFGERKDK